MTRATRARNQRVEAHTRTLIKRHTKETDVVHAAFT